MYSNVYHGGSSRVDCLSVSISSKISQATASGDIAVAIEVRKILSILEPSGQIPRSDRSVTRLKCSRFAGAQMALHSSAIAFSRSPSDADRSEH